MVYCLLTPSDGSVGRWFLVGCMNFLLAYSLAKQALLPISEVMKWRGAHKSMRNSLERVSGKYPLSSIFPSSSIG